MQSISGAQYLADSVGQDGPRNGFVDKVLCTRGKRLIDRFRVTMTGYHYNRRIFSRLTGL